MRVPPTGGYADRLMPVLLRMCQLRDSAAASARGLLCLLFLCADPLPNETGGTIRLKKRLLIDQRDPNSYWPLVTEDNYEDHSLAQTLGGSI